MHLRAAAAVADGLPDPERAELLESYATEALLAGHPEEGLHAAQTASALREELGEPEKISEDLRLISRLARWTADARQSRDAATRAVAVLEGGRAGRSLALAYGNLAHRHVHTYELHDAVAWGERAQALAEQLDDDEIAIHAATIVNAARLCQEDPAAADALEQAHRRAVERGLVDHAHRALGNLASIVSDDLARYDTAVPLIDRALAFAEQYDLDAGYAWLLGQRAKLRLERGDWSGAFADADTALARSGPRGVNAVLPFTVRGRIQAARGDPEVVTSLDEAARQADRVGDAQWVSPVVDARSEYFLWAPPRSGAAAAGGTCRPKRSPRATRTRRLRHCRSSTSWAPPVQRPPAQAAAPPRVRPGAARTAPDDRRARRRVDRPAGGDPRDGRCGDVQGRDRRAARRVGADRGPPRLGRARQARRDQPPPRRRDGRADGRDDGRLGALAPRRRPELARLSAQPLAVRAGERSPGGRR